MKIAVFGGNGQVATELRLCVPAHVDLEVIGRDRADFAHPAQVYEAARSLECDAIINAAAYTAVDQAEDEGDLAKTINGISVGSLAKACSEISAPLVHISTDYVFSGTGDAPWRPSDPVGPIGSYGQSKLLGEQELVRFADTYVVLRTSWIFSAHGKNFVKTMMRYGAERDELTVVDDEVGGPTPARDIALTCFRIAEGLAHGNSSGIYHFSGAPDVSWCEFAREIMKQAKLPAKVTPIPSSQWSSKAARPLNSRLDCSDLERDFGIERPDWRSGLKHVISELSS